MTARLSKDGISRLRRADRGHCPLCPTYGAVFDQRDLRDRSLPQCCNLRVYTEKQTETSKKIRPVL